MKTYHGFLYLQSLYIHFICPQHRTFIVVIVRQQQQPTLGGLDR